MQWVADEDAKDWRDLCRKVYWHARTAKSENVERR